MTYEYFKQFSFHQLVNDHLFKMIKVFDKDPKLNAV